MSTWYSAQPCGTPVGGIIAPAFRRDCFDGGRGVYCTTELDIARCYQTFRWHQDAERRSVYRIIPHNPGPDPCCPDTLEVRRCDSAEVVEVIEERPTLSELDAAHTWMRWHLKIIGIDTDELDPLEAVTLYLQAYHDITVDVSDPQAALRQASYELAQPASNPPARWRSPYPDWIRGGFKSDDIAYDSASMTGIAGAGTYSAATWQRKLAPWRQFPYRL